MSTWQLPMPHFRQMTGARQLGLFAGHVYTRIPPTMASSSTLERPGRFSAPDGRYAPYKQTSHKSQITIDTSHSAVWRVRIQAKMASKAIAHIYGVASTDSSSPAYIASCYLPSPHSHWVYIHTNNLRSAHWHAFFKSLPHIFTIRCPSDLAVVPPEDILSQTLCPPCNLSVVPGRWATIVHHTLHAGDIALVLESGNRARLLLLYRDPCPTDAHGRTRVTGPPSPQQLLPLHTTPGWPTDLTTIEVDTSSIQPATHIDPVTSRLLRESQDPHVIASNPWNCLRPMDFDFQPGEPVVVASQHGIVHYDDGLDVHILFGGHLADLQVISWANVKKFFTSGELVTVPHSSHVTTTGIVLQYREPLVDVVILDSTHSATRLTTDMSHPTHTIESVHCNTLCRAIRAPPSSQVPSVIKQASLPLPPPPNPLSRPAHTLPPLSLQEDVFVLTGAHKGWHGQIIDHLPGSRVVVRLDKFGAVRQFEHIILPRTAVGPSGEHIYKLSGKQFAPQRTPSPPPESYTDVRATWNPMLSSPTPPVERPPAAPGPLDIAYPNHWLYHPATRCIPLLARFKSQNVTVRRVDIEGAVSFQRTVRGRNVQVDLAQLTFLHPGRRHRGRLLVAEGEHVGHYARPVVWRIKPACTPRLWWTVQLVQVSHESKTDVPTPTRLEIPHTSLLVVHESKQAIVANKQLDVALRQH
ncbi:hypothetical protein CYLTODRAFT_492908 [Cylindrobasidium torrendii FP15055 ss-10]|uniref:KOW domain-containing protein n=1 Tax=Cylindrobasidium torrendii FP15055 ss-10 TaxID=1314674 RepID=A0A0D7B278_9AGAR|nr:hypothetical protein CYLTODRAFT_492908 [Cylindrobasidium torrendii FP15055 ss-10]